MMLPLLWLSRRKNGTRDARGVGARDGTLMPYERTCKHCGNGFVTGNVRQVRCRKDCGRVGVHQARAIARLHNDITFTGVDGEGVDRPDGAHDYVMLSVGDKTLWKDGRQLTLREILSFLWECYTEQPEAAYVGFFLGYDFIQWEKLLPEHVARSLLTAAGIAARKSNVKGRPNPYPDAVVWQGWEIDIMAGRRFKLRPHVHFQSKYDDRCRNKTCGKDMRQAEFRVVAGEMEFDPDRHYTGWSPYVKASLSHTVGARDEKAFGWMYICDTGPFWQTSFLNVIAPEGWKDKQGVIHGVCSESEYNLVAQGKSGRGKVEAYGSTDYFEEMRKYNILENDILARVTTRLNEGFMNSDIPIKLSRNEWYGPGRAAQLWMDMLHDRIASKSSRDANRHSRSNQGHAPVSNKSGRRNAAQPMGDRLNENGILNADVYMSMPAWAYDAAQASYYGGWFEQFVHGHCGNVWEYDINSAYPFIIASLPCLHTSDGHNGIYSHGNGSDYPTSGNRYNLLYATIRGSDPFIGALPFRTPQGNILRPHMTTGWYWEHEISAAQKAKLIDTIDVQEWVSYLACECSPPFNPPDIGIERLYQVRLDMGKNSPQGKSAKLVYNSAYGKTAQSIGQPKYSNPFYASLITAGCRTLILHAIASHPQGASAVTMVATDGIYFTSRHPSLPLDAQSLGAWDETFKPGMTQFMPGVYWDDNTRARAREGKSPKLKSRGVNAKDLVTNLDILDRLFAESHQALAAGNEYVWPTIQLKVKFLMDSAKLALQRGKWEQAGRVQHGSDRTISSNPISKRSPIPYRDDVSGGITRTSPYHQIAEGHTTPYLKSFGYIDETPDGVIDRDGRDALAAWREMLSITDDEWEVI
jgi:hypothetical protein